MKYHLSYLQLWNNPNIAVKPAKRIQRKEEIKRMNHIDPLFSVHETTHWIFREKNNYTMKKRNM